MNTRTLHPSPLRKYICNPAHPLIGGIGVLTILTLLLSPIPCKAQDDGDFSIYGTWEELLSNESTYKTITINSDGNTVAVHYYINEYYSGIISKVDKHRFSISNLTMSQRDEKAKDMGRGTEWTLLYDPNRKQLKLTMGKDGKELYFKKMNRKESAFDGVITAKVENGNALNSIIKELRVTNDKGNVIASGVYANGGFTITLPKTLDAKYLSNIIGAGDYWVRDRNANYFSFGGIAGYDSKGSLVGYFNLYNDSDTGINVEYNEPYGSENNGSFWYVDRDVAILAITDGDACFEMILKKGWNKVNKESDVTTGNWCVRTGTVTNKWWFKGLKETFTDKRDGKEYKTVKLGKQTWMAENLNYRDSPKSIYAVDNGGYGTLYSPHFAQKACPAGWHLPSQAEWNELIKFAGVEKSSAALKQASWDFGNKKSVSLAGWNSLGFSATPGGFKRYNIGDKSSTPISTKDVGKAGNWWSSTKADSDKFYDYHIDEKPGVRADKDGCKGSSDRDFGDCYLLSVRCVRD